MADGSESSSSEEDDEYLLRFVKNASSSGSRTPSSAPRASQTKTETELNTLNLSRQSRQMKQEKRGK